MYINELYHHGVKGQKWGVRRYQNKDGSLTNAGQKRYADGTMRFRDAKANLKNARKEYNRSYNSAYNYSSTHPISQIVSKKAKAESDKRWNDTLDKANALREAKSEYAASKTAKKKYKAAQKDLSKMKTSGKKSANKSMSKIGSKKVTKGVLNVASYGAQFAGRLIQNAVTMNQINRVMDID